MYSNLNYIKRGKGMRQKARTSLGYIGTRPGKNGQKLVRELFGRFGNYTPEEVARMIDEAPDNTLFWRFKLNPDPVLENPEKILDLRQLTRDAMGWLEERLGTKEETRSLPFVAAIHDDHTDLAHVHGIFLMERRGRERPITQEVIADFKAYMQQKALEQRAGRELVKTIASDLTRTSQHVQLPEEKTEEKEEATVSGTADLSTRESGGAEALAPVSPECPSCHVGTLSKRLNSRVYECSECGYAMRYGVTLRYGRRKEREYARSL
jgi:hypothetical protein